LRYSVIIIKEKERSDSLIFGILGNLGHFRHLFILLYQLAVTKSEHDKVGLNKTIYRSHLTNLTGKEDVSW
jgi:hypothetical protein